jgi:hypothetical protein
VKTSNLKESVPFITCSIIYRYYSAIAFGFGLLYQNGGGGVVNGSHWVGVYTDILLNHKQNNIETQVDIDFLLFYTY